MRQRLLGLGLLFCLVGCAQSQSIARPSASEQVFAHVSPLGFADVTLGPLTLGMSEAQVVALDPHPMRDKDTYGSPQILAGQWQVTLQPDTRQVGRMLITAGETPRGLRVGDSLKRATALYGTPARQTTNDATWKANGLRLTAIFDPADFTIVSLFLSRFTPVPPQQGPIQSGQGAVIALFRTLESDEYWDRFPRTITTQEGALPIGGRLGSTIPAQFETTATAEPDGTYTVHLQTHWRGFGSESDTFTYSFRVSPDGAVHELGLSGNMAAPSIK